MIAEVGDRVRYLLVVGTTQVECEGEVRKVTKRYAHVHDGHSTTYAVLHGYVLEVLTKAKEK